MYLSLSRGPKEPFLEHSGLKLPWKLDILGSRKCGKLYSRDVYGSWATDGEESSFLPCTREHNQLYSKGMMEQGHLTSPKVT